jgi:hypothetical protein
MDKLQMEQYHIVGEKILKFLYFGQERRGIDGFGRLGSVLQKCKILKKIVTFSRYYNNL